MGVHEVDEDAVLMALGNLQGEMRGYNQRMDGIGREIGEIKNSLKCKSEDCDTCRKEIDGRIDGIAKTHTGDEAVQTWWNSNITKGGIIIGIVIGIIGFFRGP